VKNSYILMFVPFAVASLWAGDVAISDGQNAEDVVGQTDSGGVGVYTQRGDYNSQLLKGIQLPQNVAIDTATHRLFVTDNGADRVLVYDLDSSNILTDRTADYVIGQANFYDNSAAVTQARLSYPTGLAFDSAANRLFVADSSSDRVLIFDVATITNGENAVNVLGQSNYTTGTQGTTQNRLYSPYGVSLDSAASRLFVSDTLNNRVMVFDVGAITDGEDATNVLGQSNFTSAASARTQSGFSGQREIVFDGTGNRLFVGDYSNNRVLIFDVANVTDGEDAVSVLGQSNFTAGSITTTQSGMGHTYGLAYDDSTQRLFVSNVLSNRVMVFDVALVTNGENAVNVLGQSNFTASSFATSRNGFYNPYGLALDAGANRLYVTDRNNSRVSIFDISIGTIADGANAENEVGQTDGAGGAIYTTRGLYDGIPAEGLNGPQDVLVDTASHRLFVADHYTCRVVVYNLDASNTLIDRTIDAVIGQDLVTQGVCLTSQSSIYNPQALTMDFATNRLFVSDLTSDRVMVFDVGSITDGENAINVLGQTTFTAGSNATSQSRFFAPSGVFFEAGTSLLYVADKSNNRVMVFDVASITDGENAVNVLGQADFTTSTTGTSQNKMSSPFGVHHDGVNRLFVCDQINNRVLVFDTTALTDGENAINVLGQSDFTTGTTGTTQSKMYGPRSSVLDRQRNRLFVSDYTSNRVLVFDVASVTDGENAVNVLGQTNFTTSSNATTQNRMFAPMGISYDAEMNRLYVSENYNQRVIVHSVGPVSPSMSSVTATTGTGPGEINLLWSSAGDDGAFNNLTGYYRIQYATYTATWSTSTTPSGAFTSTVTATNVVPGSVQATTVVVSPTTAQPWYFVLWTQDESNNWSAISSTVSASPPYVIPNYGVGPFDVTSVGGGLTQGGTGWGDFDNDGDLDVLVSGTDGTNNQVRVYKSNGNGTFNSTAVAVASANSGLKDGDVAWGDFDNDGDVDVLVSGTDNTNQHVRVYKNNGNGTFNTTALDVAGSNNGLKQGGVSWGDYDNDGDVDVLVNGTDGSNNQLRVHGNNGNGTFNETGINVAGVNSGLSQGSVAWGDFDNDADLDVLVNGTDGANRQLRVYGNNGNGTFNATPTNVAGSNNGLSDGRVAWGDFDKDGDLEVLVSGTDGTDYQLRTYANNGNGTFNATPTNVAGVNAGVTHSAVAVGDYNGDGNFDVLAAGQSSGLTGYWKLDENSGTGTSDLSGFGNNGTLTSGPTWTPGIHGSGVGFDGVNDFVTMDDPANGALDLGTGDFSISFWTQVSDPASNFKMFLLKNTNPGNPGGVSAIGYEIATHGIANGHIRTYFGDGTSILLVDGPAGFDVRDGEWHHVVVVAQRSGNARLYLDNVEGTPVSMGGMGDMSNAAPFHIGSSNGNYVLPGKMDDVRIYKRALSVGEVAGLYQATKSSLGTLRIFPGAGDGTFNATSVEVDAGLERGGVAWGDADGDGDLDILTAGSDGTIAQLSVYLSTQSLTTSNTAPTAPSTLTGGSTFNTSGVSVASFTWNAGTDSGTGATVENGLTYDIQISTTSDFSILMFPGQLGATPRMGSYLKPPKIFNSNTYYGVMLKSIDPWNAQPTASYGLHTDTTYYYRVKTVDAGLIESSWSSNGIMYSAAGPSTSTLIGTAGAGQVTLAWNSAGDDGMNGNLTGTYRIQYATYTPTWSNSTTPTNTTTVSISTTNVVPGSAQSKLITGLTGGVTYYFVLWTGDEGPNWSSISNTTSAFVATDFVWFDPNQIEVDGLNGGLSQGSVAWGDFDMDGDIDILTSGSAVGTGQLRVYKNNGNGTLDASQIEVDGLNGGVYYGGVAWGDFDQDGDLDILESGLYELRVYKNNGNGTFNPAQIEVDGLGGGLANGKVAWGDYDGDADLDILVNGNDSNNGANLRIYKNNGNATFDPLQVDVDGINMGLKKGEVGWGDFDNDGDLDILANGEIGSGANQLRIYKNNGNGTIDPAQIEVDGLNGGLDDACLAWGDFDVDGDLDILVAGYVSARQLRVYKNNGNGTIDPAQIEVDGLNNGFRYGGVAWGDFDVDGDLDILAGGNSGSNQLRVYKNNGNGTINPAQIEVDGLNNGLTYSRLAWGDFDGDSDLDILVNGSVGSDQLRVYLNLNGMPNTAPTAPAGLDATWNHNASGKSTATFMWSPAVDNGTGSTSVNGLTYSIQISTTATFSGPFVVSSQWATPGMGNYLKPPPIFSGNSKHGVMFGYLPNTNTTYYYRLKTIDAGLKESSWSDTNSLYTYVAVPSPSAVIDLLAQSQGGEGQIKITWTGPLNINSAPNAVFDVRYSTTGPITDDVGFTGATAMIGEPTPGLPGSNGSMVLTGLTPSVTYYFAIKSSNDNGSSPLDATTPRAGAQASPFDATQFEVDSVGGGLFDGNLAWGDFDNDGDIDILVSGNISPQLRVYKNNGNSTWDATQIEVDGLDNGLRYGNVAWGDMDMDGDLDILAVGRDSVGANQLRVYLNNGNGTINTTQIEVDGSGEGLQLGAVAWGDFENDGDLDVLASGRDIGTNSQLRVYKNNGNGTLDGAQIEVGGANNGLYYSSVAWGDFDGDSDLDILVSGSNASNQLRVYQNNGNGTLNSSQINVDGANNGLSTSSVAWGDFDNDGDLDILLGGTNGNPQLRIYKNNGNGTIDYAQIEVDGISAGLHNGTVAWGDYSNDGSLDILASGMDANSNNQLRVYKNNGNGTIDPSQVEVDMLDGGLKLGGVAFGDFDGDSDVDVLASGQDSGGASQLRIYSNMAATPNSAPSAPAGLAATWDFNNAIFKWNPAVDNGSGATPVNALAYQLEVSTNAVFTGKSIVPGGWATPGRGNYLNPPKIYDGNTKHGVPLRNLSQTDTTYYYRVKTVDAGLKESDWSATGNIYLDTPPLPPDSINNLLAQSQFGEGQIKLTWSAPPYINPLANAFYDVRYSTVGPITDDAEYSGATSLNGEPTPGSPGSSEQMVLTGLIPSLTYYFAIKSTNNNGTSPLDTTAVRAGVLSSPFDATQVEVDSLNGGLGNSMVTWGDFDNDGDLDILAGGYLEAPQLRIYKNNGNGSIDPAQIEVESLNNGLSDGSVAWGDFDNDGDLDILVSGNSGSTFPAPSLRIYRNNGNATVSNTQIEVAGDGGLIGGGVSWGDYDNDGDLDILASGDSDSYIESFAQLMFYRNNGNGSVSTTATYIEAYSYGLLGGGVSWGDFDADGDLDVLASGWVPNGYQLRVYNNNGNGTFDAAQIEVDGLNGGLDSGGVAWGDCDNDGDLDILTSGHTAGTRQLRVYKNNGNGTIDATQIEVDGSGNGLAGGEVTWGDYDNDGDLDILANGSTSSTRELRIYKNNGNGTVDATQIEVDEPTGGLTGGTSAWGDYDADGDLDVLASGTNASGLSQLRVYKNYHNVSNPNTIPNAPGSLAGAFSFNSTSVSVASFTWNAGSDDGAGATPENLLTYDIQISTVSNFSNLMFPGQLGASPRMGSYLKPPKIFNGNTSYGVVLKSTDPWNAQPTASYGIRADTTYYYQVKTVDAGLALSAWSAIGTLNTGVSPSTTTITASSTAVSGEVIISWASPGDDAMMENLTGTYRIQYATYPASWSTGSTPANATTVTIGTTSVVPGSTRTKSITGLVDGVPSYFVLWSQDDASNWSSISNTASVWTDVTAPSTSTLSAAATLNDGELVLTWNSAGDDEMMGNLTGNYRIQYATFTAIWSTSTTPADATTVTISTANVVPGAAQSYAITGLIGLAAYSIVVWSQDEGGNWSGISNAASAVPFCWFDPTQIEVDGMNSGLQDGRVAWGDYDNDGDLDILANGVHGGYQLRVYKNNANGTFNPTQVEVDSSGGGLAFGSAVYGDFNNDGYLDVLSNGSDGTNKQLRVYKNNQDGTFDSTQIEVDGLNGGLYVGSSRWGDVDNDGDLDILAAGNDGSNYQLRVYKNNGDGSFDPNQIEVDGVNNGIGGDVAYGDFDSDGDLDILASGWGGGRRLRIYKNNGNGTIDPNQIEVDGATGGLQNESLAWGDFNGDGSLDILFSGSDGTNRQLRVYNNNGNGTMDATQVEVDGVNGGLQDGGVSWGDFDNDGVMDILVSGTNGTTRELKVYKNNGNGTLDPNEINVDGLNGGLQDGSVAWGDYDADGDIDALVNGTNNGTNNQLRVYKNINVAANTVPTAPSTLSGEFSFIHTSASMVNFTWNAGTDSGPGATVENGLTYDIQISTTSDFSKLMFPGQLGASPGMGSYLKPPKIFNGNTSYGVVLKSTDPWNAQATASYGLRTDTTYYYRVKTVDSVLAESAWSSAGTSYTGVAPSTTTLAAAATLNDGELVLTWNSAGDDGMIGNLTGNYRIQYATFTASWSTSTTPADATTVTIATSNVVPGSGQSISVDVALIVEHYFVIWTQDEANNWSAISGTASATPFLGVRSMTIVSGSPLAFGSVNLGTQVVASTGVVVRNNGNLLNSYTLRASTYTAGTPWSVSNSPPAGPDALVLYGVYDGGTAPVLGDFGVEDVIETSAQVGSETKFSVSGAITGTSVPAGEDRPLWIRLDMPTTSQTVAPQSIRIEISAQPP
jgi:6-phosphogluconolactonase (cycloisomerase 2 family)/predicted nucleotidyltransferase